MKTFRPLASLIVLACLLLSSGSVRSQNYEWISNDDIDILSSQIPALTTGTATTQEWFGVVLTNDSGVPFTATQVHFLVAAIPEDDPTRIICTGNPRLERIRFELKIWITGEDPLDLSFGEEVLTYPGGDSEVEATVDAVTIVPLGVDLTLQDGEALTVALNFPTVNAGPCNGMLMQDETFDLLAGTRNILYATLAECPFPDFPELCEDICVDPVLRWRDFNGSCDDTVPGASGSGDFVIRLAREVEGTDDVGTADVGSPDTGSPVDAGSDQGADVSSDAPAALELSVNRITPSMGPTNQDVAVSIFGTGFALNTNVRVGPSELVGLELVNQEQLQGTLTAGLPTGTYDVIASNDGETTVFPNGFLVTDAQYLAPSIRSIEPNSVVQGDSGLIRLSGSNFAPDADVVISGRSGTGVDVASEEQITVRLPSGLAVGFHDVVVENPDGQADTLFGGLEVVSLDNETPEDGCSTTGSRPIRPIWLFLGLMFVRRSWRELR